MSAKLKKTIKEKIQDIKDQRDVIVAFLNEFVSEVKSFYLLYHYTCIMTILIQSIFEHRKKYINGQPGSYSSLYVITSCNFND